MKNFIKKLDGLLDKSCTKIILFLVRRSKYKNNKYRAYYNLTRKFNFCFALAVAVVLPIDFYFDRSFFSLSLATVCFSFIIGINILRSYRWIHMAEFYDRYFQSRKNIQVYNLIKGVCAELKLDSTEVRYGYCKMFLCLFVFMVVIWSLAPLNIMDILNAFILVDIFVISPIDNYIHHIFDFDEPPKRRKRQKDSLTELAQKTWRDLLRTPQLNPM